MTLDLNLLETFVLVAELGSFSAAAAKLGVQRSSVSRNISALENELKRQLFARTTRRLSLTTAGTTFLVSVRPLLASLQQVVQSLPEREESPAGTLRITAPQDVGVTLLANAITGFMARYPDVTVDVSLGSTPTDLVAEGFDIALRAAPGRRKDSSIVSKKLSDIELNLYASPTYLAPRVTPKRLDDIRDHEWIGFRRLPIVSLRQVTKLARLNCDDMLFARAACCRRRCCFAADVHHSR